MLLITFAILASYLIGSVPFGLMFAKIFNKKDLRGSGSGNIGATNAFRVGGKLVGVLTFFCDILKGALPVLFAKTLFPDNLWLIGITGFVSVIGHIFPIWLNFKGGKGVATTFGMLFEINYLLGLISAFLWITVYSLTKISSVSSLVMMLSIVMIGNRSLPVEYELIFILLCFIVVFKHKDNISRLLKGKE
jgi:acyl phosphate:glycerol-3-phosphate acyltransferase